MKNHAARLYLIACFALAIALACAFGERSNYLRLNNLHAPDTTLLELLRR